MDKRLELLNQYVKSIFDVDFKLVIASDDASFRRYFRLLVKNKSYIVMDAPPNKESIVEFVDIAGFFANNKINTPTIYHQNKALGFLILKDFGDITLLKNHNLELYKLAIDELLKIQQLPQNNLANYDIELLLKELNLCKEWFLEDFDYTDIFEFLLQNIKQHKSVVVHRDYHSRNIMVQNNKLGIIDFQDCIYGSYVYDLASLLRDAYLDLGDIELLQQYYFKQAKLTNYEQFILDFDIIATQRHLKILGIFKRLSVRDGKHNYLADIPQVQKYLLQMANKYPPLAKIKTLC